MRKIGYSLIYFIYINNENIVDNQIALSLATDTVNNIISECELDKNFTTNYNGSNYYNIYNMVYVDLIYII